MNNKLIGALIMMASLIPACIIGWGVLGTDSTILVMVIWIAYMIPVGFLWSKWDQKKNAPKLEKEAKIKFCEDCLANGITREELFINEAIKQKAELFAQRAGLKNYTPIDKFWVDCMKIYEEERNLENQKQYRAQIESLKVEERSEYQKLSQYASLTGRDKRVAMLKDEQSRYYKEAKSLREGMQSLVRGSQIKEIDWATHGGIASGLAGGAAGVSVAIDAQIKNAEIRAKNAETMKALAPAQLYVYNSAQEYENKARKLEAVIQDAQVKLVAETSAQDVIGKLDFENTEVKISKTGAFVVETTIKRNREIKIFDNMNAVVDGSIAAELYQKNQKVGEALIVLPVYGIGDAIRLKGICLNGAKENVPYEVKFVPNNLWEMEI